MSSSETLAAALKAEGSENQLSLLTSTCADLTHADCEKINAGDAEVLGRLNQADIDSLEAYGLDRISKNQAIWPWDDLVMDPRLVEIGKW